MKKEFWLIYVAFYIGFTVWVIWRSPGPIFIPVTDLIHYGMLIGIIGLALGKKIISKTLWQVVSVIGGLMLIHSWLVMPAIFLNNDIGWKQIAIIQLFALPTVPIFIGLYFYAWRSQQIWK